MNTPYIAKLSPIVGMTRFEVTPMSLAPATGTNFTTMLQGMLSGISETTGKPDALLESLMRGDPNVDIHDVMIANSEAELAINTTTQSLTKIIQAYDRLLQIQL
jgi:flagellar hook-basal body complex protein FliE